MNTIVEPAFAIVPLHLVRESATNPRQFFDQIKLQELAASIKISGVGQPILVRPHPDPANHPDCVEIVAGARRFRASQLAEMPTIPAIVRTMDDLEVLEFQLVENLQREDVHEIEEAEGYDRLMKDHHLDANQVATKVGKSRSYVYGRLKLLALDTSVRNQCLTGEIDASTALLLARISVPALQIKAAAEIQAGGVTWNGSLRTGFPPMSYRDAKDHINDRFMLDLQKAKFDIKCVDLLPAANACTTCFKRTGNQPEVYSDVSADICTDPDCFSAKCEAHDAKVLETAESTGLKVLRGDEASAAYEGGEYATLDDGGFNIPGIKEEHEDKDIRDMLTPDQLPEPVAYAELEEGVEPLYDMTAMRLALETAGIIMTEEEEAATETEDNAKKKANEKERKELQAQKERMAEQHTLFNTEVYNEVRKQPAAALHRPILEIALQFVFARYGSHTLWKRHDMESATEAEKKTYIDAMEDGMLQLFLLESMIHQSITCNNWSVPDTLKVNDPKDLMALASQLDIDVKPMRDKYLPKIVQEPKPKKQPAKPKQTKEVKAPTQTSPGLEPQETEPAAIATTPTTSDNQGKVTYRHPDDANLTWSPGRGRKPKWLTEFLDSGKTIEDLIKVESDNTQPAEKALKPEAAWPFPRSQA